MKDICLFIAGAICMLMILWVIWKWYWEFLLARLLKKVQWPLSLDVFNALAMAVPFVGIGLVILKPRKDFGFDTLLLQRASSGQQPDAWSYPYTLLRRGESKDEALIRIAETELGFKLERFPGFVSWFNDPVTQDGHQLSLVFCYTVDGNFKPPYGEFFPADSLPRDTTKRCRDFVSAAMLASQPTE